MTVLITSEIEPQLFPASEIDFIQQKAEQLLLLNELMDKELSLLLVSDVRMKELNEEYRKKPAPTNVLAFPMAEETDTITDNLLGDIVISIDTATREAKEFNVSLHQRLLFLLIHGLLHLIGFDHEKSLDEAQRMAEEEKRLFEAIASLRGDSNG